MALATAIHAKPVKLISDTDMGNDIDDAQALSLVHFVQLCPHPPGETLRAPGSNSFIF